MEEPPEKVLLLADLASAGYGTNVQDRSKSLPILERIKTVSSECGNGTRDSSSSKERIDLGMWVLPDELMHTIMECLPDESVALNLLARYIVPSRVVQKKILRNFIDKYGKLPAAEIRKKMANFFKVVKYSEG